MKRLFSFLIFAIIFSAVSPAQKGYRITVKAKGINNSSVRLAYYLGNSQYLKDSTRTDDKGQFVFSGEKSLPYGVYTIVFPGNKYFEFIAEDDQNFSINCDTTNLPESVKFEGSEINLRFQEYQSGWKELQDKAASLQKEMKEKSGNNSESEKLKDAIRKHEDKMKLWLQTESEKNKGNLLGAIVKSIIPVPVNIADIPAGIKNQDSVKKLWSYIYYKDHFFDNTDILNPGLIRTPILASKLDQFFSQVVIQAPDSINKEADILIKKCSPQKDVYQYVTSWIFNKYASSTYMGHDAVVVHLADSIYLAGKAPWVSKEFIADLSKRVKLIKPNLIGNKAVDLVMNSFSGQFVSLYDVKSDFTILYFWEPDCGHCKEATPKLKDFYDKNKGNSIEVFAVCIKDDKDKWEKYILDHDLTWINGWDPDRVSHFDYYYDVESTPLIYILDRNKKIIAKKLSVENIGPFIENYRNYLRSESTTSVR